jgi:hypothetical protein
MEVLHVKWRGQIEPPFFCKEEGRGRSKIEPFPPIEERLAIPAFSSLIYDLYSK